MNLNAYHAWAAAGIAPNGTVHPEPNGQYTEQEWAELGMDEPDPEAEAWLRRLGLGGLIREEDQCSG